MTMDSINKGGFGLNEEIPQDTPVGYLMANHGRATTSTKRSRVINRDYVKRWALDYASTNRMHKFSRVSESFLNTIEADTKSAIRNRIMRHPSKGKTLQ